MKKITSILLLSLLVFNWFGYRILMNFMQHKYDTTLETQIETNRYDESQLVELKIPMHLPYQNNWSDYERFDGEVQYNGTFYKYVKRKVANDTLYLKCISNAGKTRTELAKNDFYKNTNDISPAGNKKDNSKAISFKKILLDYDNYLFSFHSNKNCESDFVFLQPRQSVHFPSPSARPGEQPPDLLS